jgi:hypothetical protein
MSLILLLAAALAPCQDPKPAPTADVVVMRSGEELRGKVLAESDEVVEIKIGDDTTIGLDRRQVKEVRRAKAATPPPAVEPDPAPVPAPTPSQPEPTAFAGRDAWYVLHDGEGIAVGTLHAGLKLGEADTIRIAEEWDFVTEKGRVQITRLETLALDGVPLACFYHERAQREHERLSGDERLVRAEYRDGKLNVVATNSAGTQQRSYAVGAGLQFPLSLRELLRQRPANLGFTGSRMVYDASRDELARASYTSGDRRVVQHEGKRIEVREIAAEASGARNAEWVDGTSHALRREVAGPALVAVRSTKDMAQAMCTNSAKAFPPAVLRETEGRFSLWLPNPIWRFDDEQTPGHVTATAALYDASVSALVLDHVDPATHLDTAMDAVERWLKVACRDFKARSRTPAVVRGQTGLALEGSYLRVTGSKRERLDVSVRLLRGPEEQFVAVCLAAPSAVHADLEPDFARMVDSLDLHPASVAAQTKRGKPKIAPR